jgi:Putative MetA-pathway of phenol degradation
MVTGSTKGRWRDCMRPTLFRAACLLSALVLGAAPESGRAAHPLVTDDTGTRGTGNWQLELLGQRDRHDHTADPGGGPLQQHRKSTFLNSVLTYGLLENLDLAVGLNHARYRVSENGAVSAAASGMSDSSLELKWRLHEQNGLSFALKPGIQIPTGDESRGLGTGRTSWGVNLIAAYDAKPCILLGNIAYSRARFKLAQDEADNRGHLWRVSSGVAYAVRHGLKLVGELGVRTNPTRNDPFLQDRNGRFAMLGAIYSPTENIDLDIGLRKGLNHAETDTAFLVGATFRW